MVVERHRAYDWALPAHNLFHRAGLVPKAGLGSKGSYF
jgi:hypothetical protein